MRKVLRHYDDLEIPLTRKISKRRWFKVPGKSLRTGGKQIGLRLYYVGEGHVCGRGLREENLEGIILRSDH